MSDTTVIPPPLLDKLAALKPLLETGGCVQARRINGRVSYRLRYRALDQDVGYVIHRSLHIGGDKDVAAAVKTMIQHWRDTKEVAEQQVKQARRTDTERTSQQRQLVRGIVKAHGGGGRRQRRAVVMFNQAQEAGPRELFKFAFTQEFLEVRKPGRPCRRLW